MCDRKLKLFPIVLSASAESALMQRMEDSLSEEQLNVLLGRREWAFDQLNHAFSDLTELGLYAALADYEESRAF